MTLKRGLTEDKKTFGKRGEGVIVTPDPFSPGQHNTNKKIAKTPTQLGHPPVQSAASCRQQRERRPGEKL